MRNNAYAFIVLANLLFYKQFISKENNKRNKSQFFGSSNGEK